MRGLCTVAVAVALAAPVAAWMCASADAQQGQGAGQPQTTVAAATPYRPPLRGAPGGRIGGGTRGTEYEEFSLSVLAPDHTGLTTEAQPVLYWFVSRTVKTPLEFTVTDPRTTQPVLEVPIPSPPQAGIQRIRLADHGIRLEPGVPYRWYIAAVPDPDRRSRDILAGGVIERVELPDAVRTRIAGRPLQEHPGILADASLWYDALGAISNLIEAAPEDRSLREYRAALLMQVGLEPSGEESPARRQ